MSTSSVKQLGSVCHRARNILTEISSDSIDGHLVLGRLLADIQRHKSHAECGDASDDIDEESVRYIFVPSVTQGVVDGLQRAEQLLRVEDRVDDVLLSDFNTGGSLSDEFGRGECLGQDGGLAGRELIVDVFLGIEL
jgi:hypothetical protein